MPGTSTSAARGLDGVVAARTRLSHVDGDRGELIIGGYELKELAGRAHFEDAAHLLWRGALPTRDELGRLRRELAAVRALPEETLEVVRAAATAPPIDALRMACATLSLDLANPDDISPTADLESAKRLTARFPTVLAAHARISEGNEPIAPRADLPHAANFLYMLHGTEPDPAAARALDTYWVTVIDHGMNASTFAARVIASTRSDMVSAVTGSIGALKGPLTVARPARCSRCCGRSARPTAPSRGCGTSSRPVGASWASVTASTKFATRAPTSSPRWWTRWRRRASKTGRCSIWRAPWSRPACESSTRRSPAATCGRTWSSIPRSCSSPSA